MPSPVCEGLGRGFAGGGGGDFWRERALLQRHTTPRMTKGFLHSLAPMLAGLISRGLKGNVRLLFPPWHPLCFVRTNYLGDQENKTANKPRERTPAGHLAWMPMPICLSKRTYPPRRRTPRLGDSKPRTWLENLEGKRLAKLNQTPSPTAPDWYE